MSSSDGNAGTDAAITGRVAKLSSLDGERRSLTPPAPRSAKIELTSRCNYACTYCASHLRDGRRTDMPWPLYTRLARELRVAGVEQLGLFYIGESLLYPRLADAVRYAKQDCAYPYVFLTTNGSPATASRVAALMEAGLDSLKFALNFADGMQFAAGAGAPARTLETVRRNVLDACDLRDALEARTGRRCLVSASSLRYDDGQPERMAALIEELAPRLDQHYWLPMYGDPGTWRTLSSPGGAATGIARKPLPCWPLFTEAHVTVEGWLAACSLDDSPRFRIADLGAVPFMAGWHSPQFRALRAAHLAGDVGATACAQCIGYARTHD